jgi:hypothetical protein
MATHLETRHGRRAAARTSREARDYVADARGGWSIVSTSRGGAGMTAHRGVLHPEEYVDTPRLRALVEHRLGFTRDELGKVYRQGRKSAAQLELRARVDARLLELREAGGDLALLARITRIERKTIARALVRARM